VPRGIPQNPKQNKRFWSMGGNSSKEAERPGIEESNWDDILSEIHSNLRQAHELSAEISRTERSLSSTPQSVQLFLNRRVFVQEVMCNILKSDWPSVVQQLTAQADARILQLFAVELFDLSFASQRIKSGSQSMSALMVAVIQGAPSLVLSLLLSFGAELEARDAFGLTPLMLSARYGRFESLLFLLHQGAKTDTLSFDGKSIDKYASEIWALGKPWTNGLTCPAIQVMNTFRRNLLQSFYLTCTAGLGMSFHCALSSQCPSSILHRHAAPMSRLARPIGLVLTEDIRLRCDMPLVQHKQRVQLLTLRAILQLLVSRMFLCDTEQHVMQAQSAIFHRCHSELGAMKIARCFLMLAPPEANICIFRNLNDDDIHVTVNGPVKKLSSPPVIKSQPHLPTEYAQQQCSLGTIQLHEQCTFACFAGKPSRVRRVPCRDWSAVGCCRFGSSCKYEHAVDADEHLASLKSLERRKKPICHTAKVINRPCWHWNNGGTCFWGDSCHFVH
jgi:hypothetical protein